MDSRIGAKDLARRCALQNGSGTNQVAIVKACGAAEAKSANARKVARCRPRTAPGRSGLCIMPHPLAVRNDSPGSNIHGRLVTPKEDVDLAVRLRIAAPPRICGDKTRTNGGVKVAHSLESFSTSTRPKPPIRWWPSQLSQPILTTGPNSISWLAGSLCGSSVIPGSASEHFDIVDKGATDPRILARAAYWRGRAAEAAGQIARMRAEYKAAVVIPQPITVNWRAPDLDGDDVALRPPPRAVIQARMKSFRRRAFSIRSTTTALP